MRKISAILIAFLMLWTLVACAKDDIDEPITEAEPVLSVEMNGVETQFSREKLMSLDGQFEAVYSAINNWPSDKIYAAKGVTLESVLKSAGAYDDMQSVTFVSADGYEMSFTRSQAIEMEQSEYINGCPVSEVYSLLAYKMKEDCIDLTELNDVEEDDFAFVIGQTNPTEHTNHAFVEDVVKIIVSTDEPEQWAQTTTFPTEGTEIASGDSIKLQHEYFGLVKIYYTTDGTDPTVESDMYNPSTYQPELNMPIMLTENIVIKTLVVGYGKENSEIQTHEFEVAQ